MLPNPNMSALGPGASPLGGQDPQSAYLQQALGALQKTPSQGNTMGLGSNLLAEALDQYALRQHQGAPVSPQVGGVPNLQIAGSDMAAGPANSPFAGLARMFGGG